MAERNDHKFEFRANVIAGAARNEARYHRERIDHWTERRDQAKAKVASTISAKLIEQPMTGGMGYSVIADYGDREAWDELQLAQQKISTHRLAAERHESDAEVYGSQGERPYMLDAEDVHHFRLSGRKRED